MQKKLQIFIFCFDCFFFFVKNYGRYWIGKDSFPKKKIITRTKNFNKTVVIVLFLFLLLLSRCRLLSYDHNTTLFVTVEILGISWFFFRQTFLRAYEIMFLYLKSDSHTALWMMKDKPKVIKPKSQRNLCTSEDWDTIKFKNTSQSYTSDRKIQSRRSSDCLCMYICTNLCMYECIWLNSQMLFLSFFQCSLLVAWKLCLAFCFLFFFFFVMKQEAFARCFGFTLLNDVNRTQIILTKFIS